MNNLEQLKVAIVYDRVNKFGGAERVLLTLHNMFPNAPLYTSVYYPKNAPWAAVFPKIHTSFLQRIPFANKNHELFGWLMPFVFESFDFSDYDLVISVTSEAAKGIVTKPDTVHVCYCLTPTRYLWSHYDEYFKNVLLRMSSRLVVKHLRRWDVTAAQRPDELIAISTEVGYRVEKFYNRKSQIIFPPVNSLKEADTKQAEAPFVEKKDFFLYIGRLVPYKKVELLVKVFNAIKLPLVIIGVGSQLQKLKLISSKNISFTGTINDCDLDYYFKHTRALVMPQLEDFGIVAVEAQKYGVPVIAYGVGGARDTVIDGKTGVLFNEQTESSLKQVIAKFDKMGFNHSYIKRHAEKFKTERFVRQLQRSLIRAYTGRGWGNKTLAKVVGRQPQTVS